MNKVAVITPTIGRPELQQCVDSVKAQTMPCTHYVFVDGEHNWDRADAVLFKESDIVVTQIPMAPGSGGYRGSPYFAGVPWMLREDYIAYLDDDNWWDANHIQSCIDFMERCDLDACFSLRKLVEQDGSFIDIDDCVSLGYYPNFSNKVLADTSTIVVRTSIARKHGHAWYNTSNMDQMFTQELICNKVPLGITGLHTLNYRLSSDSLNTAGKDWFLDMNKQMREIYKSTPWCKESVIKYKESL